MRIVVFGGIFDTPIHYFVLFYLFLGFLGFSIGLWKRWLVIFPILAVIVFGVRDLQTFFAWQFSLTDWPVMSTLGSMFLAIIASGIGAKLNLEHSERKSLQ